MKHAGICVLMLIALVGCKKASVRHAEVDACALLTREEIQSVQGSTITDAKPSKHSEATFRVSQCFFTAQETNKSVSLVVTQAASGNSGRSPKDYWEQTFVRAAEHKEEDEKEKEKENEEREREAGPPIKIEGVGDDAYWIQSPVGGTLYTLKDDMIVRLSLGGPDEPQTKIDKSKTLAKKILERF